MDPQKAQILIKAVIGIAQVIMLMYSLTGGMRSAKKNEAHDMLAKIIADLEEIKE